MKVNQKVAVVTGPTGAVGTALIDELIANQVKVYAVCRQNSTRTDVLPKHSLVNVIFCDLQETAKLTELISEPCDMFFHLAWEGTYGASRDDLEIQLKNVSYMLDAVKVAHKLGCQVFLGAGSQAECGRVEGKISPDTPCFPTTGYGIAKLSACLMSRAMCKQLGIRHEWCRILSMYGANDKNYTMVMSSICRMLDGEYTKYTKGEQIWDYIYNKDAARAFYLAAEKGKDGAVYCLGSGQTRRLCDYIYAIRDAVNPDLPIGIGELAYYPNQVMYLQADLSNLTADTGFVPRYSFEEGIRETVDWVRAKRQEG